MSFHGCKFDYLWSKFFTPFFHLKSMNHISEEAKIIFISTSAVTHEHENATRLLKIFRYVDWKCNNTTRKAFLLYWNPILTQWKCCFDAVSERMNYNPKPSKIYVSFNFVTSRCGVSRPTLFESHKDLWFFSQAKKSTCIFLWRQYRIKPI